VATELNDFLNVEGAPADAEAPPDTGVPETPQAADDAAPADETAPAETPAEPAADPADALPDDVRGLRNALQAERGKRNDYKGERDRLAGELAATKAALAAAEAARVAQPAPPAVPPPAEPTQPPQVPNPLEDPAGYHAYNQRMLFNERLNISEAMLREAPGIEAVDEKLAAFKKAMDANPALRAEFSRQPHPYRWAYDQGAKQLALAEVGDDPAAFRARIEAEIRAKIEAEMAETAPAPAQGGVAPVVLPRSLASATSSAPRMQAVEPAPEFEQIFAPRKRRA
jgi:hypothetical protein